MARLDIHASPIGFEYAGVVQGDLFKGRIVGNAAVFAEFLQALTAIEASDLMGGCFDGAVRLDNIGDAAVENASRRVFEKLLRNVFEDARVVMIRDRFMRRTSGHRPDRIRLASCRMPAA